jgi:sugar transferase EpsL
MSRVPIARRPVWARAAKRAIDVVGSAAALVVVSPLLAAIAAVVRLRLGRPVLFMQRRTGIGGRTFPLQKFRTMTDGRDDNGELLSDSERLTPLGRRLRDWSLDELPELWHVLTGDMSLVGPRPLLTQYLDRYGPEQLRRLAVKPGITGWAQVNGRNELSWEERLALDTWYVDHWSLWLDLRILARTPAHVLSRRGIAHPGHDTMPEFGVDGGRGQ